MKTGIIISGVIAIIILIIGGTFIGINSDSPTVAFLYIEEGQVEVNLGSGWQAAIDEMELSKDDSVRTGEGKATIVFFEKDMMTLQPNTEVSLSSISENNIQVAQQKGETWNRVEKLAGRTYEVSSPTSVATVRGTGFNFGIGEDGDNLLVDDGEVDFSVGGKKQTAKENEFYKGFKDGRIEKKELTIRELTIIKQKLTKDISNLKRIRMKAINRNKFVLKQMEKRGFAREDMREFLKDLDRGERTIDEVRDRLPVKLAMFNRMEKVTLRIQRLQERLERVNTRITELG